VIRNGQRFFLVSATLGAFALGTAAGSLLTFGPGQAVIATEDQPAGASLDGSMMLAAEVQKEPAAVTSGPVLETADAGIMIASEAGIAITAGGTTGKNEPPAAEEAGEALPSPAAGSLQSLQASTRTDRSSPTALPGKETIMAPAPALSSETELANIARLSKAALTPRPWATQAITARSGDSLTTILKRAGVEGRQIHAALQSLRGVYDPRGLRVGQELAVTAAALERQPTQLLSVAFDLDFDHQILITRDADGSFTTKRVEQAKRRELVHRAGKIENSLYLSAMRQAIPNSVTDRLIQMFSWDVDFQRDIRRGDSFETLYEEVTLEKDESQVKGELVYAGLNVRGRLIDAYLYSREGERANYYDSQGRSLRKFLLRTPIDGARLSSPFGKRKHPVLGYTKIHKGTDFAAPRGTPIFAGGSGVVERADRYGSYGNYLRIRHSDTYSTAYGHLQKFAKGVKPGTRVRQGQIVAYVGTTGRSTGPHLHYEVLKNGEQINPMTMKHPPATQLAEAELAVFKKEVVRIDAMRARLARQQRLASRSTAGQAVE
jgi:murein DD-endopeptidase MepM/ murein hydrolase activator NlpD